MSKEKFTGLDLLAAVAFGFVMSAMLVGTAVWNTQQLKWKAEAVEHHAAEYHPRTGAWHWIDLDPQP